MAGGLQVGLQLAAAQSSGPVASSSHGVQVTAGGSANAVGSYTTLISSTSHDCAWLMVVLNGPATNLLVFGINIAVGAAGSEIVIIPDLVLNSAQYNGNPLGQAIYFFPCSIPAGTRISANCQATTASAVATVSVYTFDDAFASFGAAPCVDTYGYSTSTGLGTTIDPGSTSNTKGSYSQITSATTNDLAGFFLGFDGGTSSTASANGNWSIDLAIGASGSEKIVLPDLLIQSNYTSTALRDINPSATPFLAMPIPAGTRVAARAQSNQTNANARVFNLTFYGVRR